MNLLSEFAQPEGFKLVVAFRMCLDEMPMGHTVIDRNYIEDEMLERIDKLTVVNRWKGQSVLMQSSEQRILYD